MMCALDDKEKKDRGLPYRDHEQITISTPSAHPCIASEIVAGRLVRDLVHLPKLSRVTMRQNQKHALLPWDGFSIPLPDCGGGFLLLPRRPTDQAEAENLQTSLPAQPPLLWGPQHLTSGLCHLSGSLYVLPKNGSSRDHLVMIPFLESTVRSLPGSSSCVPKELPAPISGSSRKASESPANLLTADHSGHGHGFFCSLMVLLHLCSGTVGKQQEA